jgi:hypothetical protein
LLLLAGWLAAVAAALFLWLWQNGCCRQEARGYLQVVSDDDSKNELQASACASNEECRTSIRYF